MQAESRVPAQGSGDSQSWGRWEMAASDQSEAEMVTRRPIRGQHGDTDSTVQTPGTCFTSERETWKHSHLITSSQNKPDKTRARHLNSRDSNPFMRVVED